MVEITAAAADPAVRELTVVTGAQTGKTDGICLSIIGHRLDDGPRVPVLYVAPTQKLTLSVAADRFTSMLLSTPSLRAKWERGGRRDKVAEKWIAGVRVGFAWAGSAVELASHPAGLVLIDELDLMERDVGGAGDPRTMALARARTYAASLAVTTSTPTIADASPIEALFLEGSMHVLELPCCHCGAYFRPLGRDLRWPKDARPDTVRGLDVFVCPACETPIPDAHKPAALAAHRLTRYRVAEDGELEPDPDPPPLGRHRSYWISGLASPWVSWSEQAAQLCAAYRSGQHERVQAQVNLGLGELWRVSGDRPDWQAVHAHRIDYPRGEPPHGVQLLTAGVDVQRDGLYWLVRGWGERAESWLVAWGRLWGTPEYDEVWMALMRELSTGYAGLRVRFALVDSGYNPARDYWRRPDHKVYSVCRRSSGLLAAAKGYDDRARPLERRLIDVTDHGHVVKNGAELWLTDAAYWKRWVYSRIRSEVEGLSDRWHVPRDVDEDYCRQVTSEEIIRTAAGREQWVARRSRPNHYLDCEALATAAAYALNAEQLGPAAPPLAPGAHAVPAPRRSGRFDRSGL